MRIDDNDVLREVGERDRRMKQRADLDDPATLERVVEEMNVDPSVSVKAVEAMRNRLESARWRQEEELRKRGHLEGPTLAEKLGEIRRGI